MPDGINAARLHTRGVASFAPITSIAREAAVQGLIEALAKLSPDFRRWWEQPNHETYRYGIGTILDADSSLQKYEHAMLLVDEHRHLRMVVYFDEA